jgi:sterol desaturase/sphingolipid hydroxylase (fatty acid hydroxylase superfamily)
MPEPMLVATLWLLVCVGLFGTLQHLFPHDRAQPMVRKDAWVDAVYWIGAPLAYGGVSLGMMAGGLAVIFQGDAQAIRAHMTNGADWADGQPLWLLALGVLIVTDFSMYWTHRLFHAGRLWRYHAIHHAPEHLDFLHAARFHPVNFIAHGVFANALALWIGFPPAAIAALAPFNILYSAMVHANLNWTFGPLRYVFASPVFHRWHHTGPDEGGSSNFAATFSCLDLLFGTWHMPEGVKPGATGIVDRDMPEGLVGQLLYPFKPAAAPAPSPAPETEERPAGAGV